jgi:Tfp pilus assembly protein PilX
MAAGLVKYMRRQSQQLRRQTRGKRRGAALLISMFIVFIVAILTVNVLDTETLEFAALRNSIEYEKALYLANAGVHHVAAELESNSTWRGTVSEGSYPADNTYTATAVSGTNNTVIVTARGASGGIIRTVTATIEL